MGVIDKLKVGDRVRVSGSRWAYDGYGEIIRETKCYWVVRITEHSTFGESWKESHDKEEYFHKKNNLSKGFSRHIDTDGDFYILSKRTKAKSFAS